MAPSTDVERLDLLQTEARTSTANKIDLLDTLGLCEEFNKEERRVGGAVACCLPTIASLIDDLAPRLEAGGRLIYVGAGNSGRVGFMDCSELPVTFSVDPQQFLTVVAGGTEAIIQAQEGAEDVESDGALRMEALQLNEKDTVIGISASGRTPFVLGALRVALKHDALTAGITNTYPSRIDKLGVKHSICPLVGPEFLTGSTRLKAGSAAKQILNMISTCSMVKLGKTYKGLMIDVRVNNWKLKARGRRIVRQVCNGALIHIIEKNGLPSSQAVDVPETADGDAIIDSLIRECQGSVKLACAVAISGFPPDISKQMLDSAGGNFHVFVQGIRMKAPPSPVSLGESDYCLCVDGGGTNCTVSIATESMVVGQGVAGPCNFNAVTLDELMDQIKLATKRASSTILARQGFGYPNLPRFSKVWVGLAGLYHADQVATLTHRLEELFDVSIKNGTLRLTSDGILLGSCIAMDDSVECAISVIAGTGSVATAFKKAPSNEIVQVGRTGGCGYLIGDQGSAFDIGKRALQLVLSSVEQRQFQATHELTEFERVILEELNSNEAGVLTQIYHSDAKPKEKISDMAKVVTKLGFRERDPDPQALGILTSAAGTLLQQIKPLTEICDPRKCALILSGALMNLPDYQNLILQEWDKQQQSPFKKVLVVNDASGYAAQFLARQNMTIY
ncbi:putative sugar phosphate isomerase [Aspergillus oryzae 100-8]|uniref:N-acetyl-D-glucosamine kinase n=1 Tax=Aspergillus oryzae (strain 3.042) TaxID=1160506 RepID=I7ZY50_ASPO3|nr:putative sugar phosphate isomerase [Aspergillus oryzae 3.042]KDE85649.1 putative sugar phosphate isomerase [Aspergillus oryzae 100-8]|eukprot:EIT77219.1 putative sugar phosphate isomerase [Aspergillus oryzae 3.042]